MLTEFGTKLFFFMSDPKQVSRHLPALQDAALAAPP